MTKQEPIWVVVGLAVIVLLLLGAFWWRQNNQGAPAPAPSPPAAGEVGRAIGRTVENPARALPAINPFEGAATNPFADLYQNPFE